MSNSVAIASEAPAPSGSLQAKFARGSMWALIGYGGQQVLRVLSQHLLWRYLYEAAFGAMTLVNAFMIGLALFSDVGIGPSIIQNERGEDPDYLNTAWTIQVMRGFALFAVSLVAAAPMAWAYHEPQLSVLIPVATAGSLIVSGFNSTKLFTVTRQMALGRLTAIELISQAAGLVTMVAHAAVYRSIWALVIGNVVTNLVRLALGHVMLPGVRNRFRWDKSSVHSLVHFGRWIFVSTLLTFLVGQSDRFVFGKLVTLAELGVYSMGANWASFPTQILAHVLQSVMFPLFSRVHNDKGNLPAIYREARAPALFATGCLCACLISGGPMLIQFVLDKRAFDAGWIIQVLTVGTWFLALESTNGQALLAVGWSKWIAAGSLAKLCGMVVLITLGFIWFGFPGAIVGFSASEIFKYSISLLGAHRAKLGGWRQDVVFTFLVGATTVLGFGVRHLARHLEIARIYEWNVRAGAFVEGAMVFVVIAAVWGTAFLWHRRRTKSALALHPGERVEAPPLVMAPSTEILPLGEEVPPPSQETNLQAVDKSAPPRRTDFEAGE